jgi:hypothetical protein
VLALGKAVGHKDKLKFQSFEKGAQEKELLSHSF